MNIQWKALRELRWKVMLSIRDCGKFWSQNRSMGASRCQLKVYFALILAREGQGLRRNRVRYARDSQRVLEDQSLSIAFAFSFRLCTVFADRLLFSTFNPTLPTS
jgi:hypothetical protein